jgi:hypothetical protein
VICNCGGKTKDKSMSRRGRKIAEYKLCTACGRIEWIWKSWKTGEKP